MIYFTDALMRSLHTANVGSQLPFDTRKEVVNFVNDAAGFACFDQEKQALRWKARFLSGMYPKLVDSTIDGYLTMRRFDALNSRRLDDRRNALPPSYYRI